MFSLRTIGAAAALFMGAAQANLAIMNSMMALPPLEDESIALARRASGAGSFKQLIDHNNPSLGTFEQRFWWNDEYWGGPGSPVVLMTPGEADADAYTAYITNATIQGWIAREIDGAAILLEHRYWGTSVPVPDFTSENMKYLTVENSMKDLIYFAKNVQLPFDPERTSTPSKAPWVLSGGSFSGALAAWVNHNYPGTFWAYHSSAAVVQGIENFWNYFEPVLTGMPKNCSSDVYRIIENFEQTFKNGSDEQKKAFKDEFSLGLVEHDDDVANALQSGLYSFQTKDFYSGYNAFHQFCDYVENQFVGGTAPAPGAEGVGLEKARAGYARWVNEILLPIFCAAYAAPGDSLEVIASKCFDTHSLDNPLYTDSSIATPANRQWYWLLCSEPMKWWLTGAPEGQPSLVGRAQNVEFWERQCGLFFDGPDGKGTYGIKEGRNVTDTNELTGGWEAIPGKDRIVYVNGEFDPWLGATPAAPEFPGGPYQGTPEAPHYIIPEGMHCSDFFAANARVNPGTKQVMDKVVAHIAEWVAEFKPKKC